MNRDQFFQWTAPAPGRYAFRALGDYNASFLAKIALYEGTGCTATCLELGSSFNLFGSIAFLTAQAGDTVLIQYGGVIAGGVGFTAPLEIELLEGDTCEYPLDIAGLGDFLYSTAGFSGSGFSGTAPCVGMPAFQRDFFFRWVAPGGGNFRFQLDYPTSSSGTVHLAIYDGAQCAVDCLGFDSASIQGGGRAEISLPGLQAGQAYLIRTGSTGFLNTGVLEISSDLCSSPDAFEPNESFAQARPLPTGLNQGLNVYRGGMDFYSITLQPGEAAFLQANTTSGPQVEIQRYGLSGSTIFTPSGLGPGDPLWVNVYGEPRTFRFSVGIDPQGQGDCSTYDLDLGIGPDPCGFGGVVSPPTIWLEPGLHAGLPLSWAEWNSYRIVVPGNTEIRLDYLSGPLPQGAYALLRDPQHNIVHGGPTGVAWTNSTPWPVSLLFSMHWVAPSHLYFLNECIAVDVQVTAGEALGVQYCSPGVINTSGQSGIVRAQGSSVAAENDLTLVALQLPPGEFAFFLGSQTQAFVPWPGGSRGHLCLGGALARFNGQVGPISNFGSFIQPLDLSDVPEPPFFHAVVQAGETWNFQLWHRDNLFGPASNFTSAVSVLFD